MATHNIIRHGLCCISEKLRDSGVSSETMTKSSFLKNKSNSYWILSEKIQNNFDVLYKISDVCEENDWDLRIGSDLIPLITLPEANYKLEDLPNFDHIKYKIKLAREKIKSGVKFVSMHPDQFVVIASKKESAAESAIIALEYHNWIMSDLLELPQTYAFPINVHMNCYEKGNDLEAIFARFESVWNRLSDGVKKRLTLENEDKPNSWSVRKLHDFFYKRLQIPICYDNLHHDLNPDGLNNIQACELAYSTWPSDIIPRFHFCAGTADNKRKHAEYAPAQYPEEYTKIGNVCLDFEFKAKDYAIKQFEKTIQG